MITPPERTAPRGVIGMVIRGAGPPTPLRGGIGMGEFEKNQDSDQSGGKPGYDQQQQQQDGGGNDKGGGWFEGNDGGGKGGYPEGKPGADEGYDDGGKGGYPEGKPGADQGYDDQGGQGGGKPGW